MSKKGMEPVASVEEACKLLSGSWGTEARLELHGNFGNFITHYSQGREYSEGYRAEWPVSQEIVDRLIEEKLVKGVLKWVQVESKREFEVTDAGHDRGKMSPLEILASPKKEGE